MMLCVLNHAFEYACDMEYIDENPCSKVRRAKTDVKKVEAFTLEEQKKLEEVIIKSGVRKLNFHALRHTFATRAIECGIDVKTATSAVACYTCRGTYQHTC